MRRTSIHPTALVDPDASIGDDTCIGAYSVVEAGAVLGSGCRLASHVAIRADVRLGDEVQVDSFAVIGGWPQLLACETRSGTVSIGDRTVVREGVTINLPSGPGGSTAIGPDCYLMAQCHVGHDCIVGESVTLANNVMLAGHVTIGDFVVLGGGAGVHQFVRIGDGAMIGGNASISYDVPPYAIAAERNEICGLNLVGIRRRGMAPAALADLKRCFRAVFRSSGNVSQLAAAAFASGKYGGEPEGRHFLEFFTASKRGFAHQRSAARRDQSPKRAPRGEDPDAQIPKRGS
ncbi:MAG: acyl-ACP--UDP-N-acetylglucosamine O-acyltransferase [Planctomycetes bacterium]|nr:acyl-ACP--UDP-N-acetylglucosamine O-acyltransferase [Planctomycetota bacterium]